MSTDLKNDDANSRPLATADPLRGLSDEPDIYRKQLNAAVNESLCRRFQRFYPMY